MTQSPDVPRRLRESPMRLILTAIGGPRQIAGKLARIWRTVKIYAGPREVDRRLDCLLRKGLIAGRPNRWQLAFGGVDMLRFVIEPASREYYESKGIGFGFHQLLRILDDPVSMIDPTGFYSDRDTIIGHVMQVVHLNPVYDLQILDMFDDGLDQLEQQVEAMVEGRHPRQQTIGAIVEDPEYHARLLWFVRSYRADRTAAPPVREQGKLRQDASFAAAERTFATLPGFIAYAERLPQRPLPLLRRLRATRRFPVDQEISRDVVRTTAA